MAARREAFDDAVSLSRLWWTLAAQCHPGVQLRRLEGFRIVSRAHDGAVGDVRPDRHRARLMGRRGAGGAALIAFSSAVLPVVGVCFAFWHSPGFRDVVASLDLISPYLMMGLAVALTLVSYGRDVSRQSRQRSTT